MTAPEMPEFLTKQVPGPEHLEALRIAWEAMGHAIRCDTEMYGELSDTFKGLPEAMSRIAKLGEGGR